MAGRAHAGSARLEARDRREAQGERYVRRKGRPLRWCSLEKALLVATSLQGWFLDVKKHESHCMLH